MALRETVAVGVVGAGGLGLLLHKHFTAFDCAAVLTTILTLILLTLMVDLLSAAVRRSLV